jgi:hypothetical protein
MDMSKQDAVRDIERSIISLNGSIGFFRFNDVDDSSMLGVFSDYSLGGRKVVDISKEEVVAPLGHIGFMNTKSKALALSRVRDRSFQIGLRAGRNIAVLDLYQERHRNESIFAKENKDGLFEMLNGTYPSITDAFKLATQKKSIHAFDRDFAVDIMGLIYYINGAIVGQLGEDLKPKPFPGCEAFLELLEI